MVDVATGGDTTLFHCVRLFHGVRLFHDVRLFHGVRLFCGVRLQFLGFVVGCGLNGIFEWYWLIGLLVMCGDLCIFVG